MKSLLRSLIGLMLISLIFGCARTQYAWHDYDKNLYGHYKDASKKEEFAMQLKETLEEAEASNRVPPGIYAEYGFLLYEQGNSLQAVKYYQKEYDLWPESRIFMTKMINSAQKRIKTQNIAATVNVPNVDPMLTTPAKSEVSK